MAEIGKYWVKIGEKLGKIFEEREREKRRYLLKQCLYRYATVYKRFLVFDESISHPTKDVSHWKKTEKKYPQMHEEWKLNHTHAFNP